MSWHGAVLSPNGTGGIGLVGTIADFLGDYIVLPRPVLAVVSGWVAASWLVDLWVSFPHLAIYSPEEGCGKTTLLELLKMIVLREFSTVNSSPAVIYRKIEQDKVTLLYDEFQAIKRRGSEASEVIHELFCAGVRKHAKVHRMGGQRYEEVIEFNIYGGKAFALIGQPGKVVLDRSFPVVMHRKKDTDKVKRFFQPVVEPVGKEVFEQVKRWATDPSICARVAEAYKSVTPFSIKNDRMAELYMPLQAVLAVTGESDLLDLVREYAEGLDKRASRRPKLADGTMLLIAFKAIFDKDKAGPVPSLVTRDGTPFIYTSRLIRELSNRDDEPWATYTRGQPITGRAISDLLEPYEIESARSKDEDRCKGYYARDFAEAWERYIPDEKRDEG
jgi:hypothetical protein